MDSIQLDCDTLHVRQRTHCLLSLLETTSLGNLLVLLGSRRVERKMEKLVNRRRFAGGCCIGEGERDGEEWLGRRGSGWEWLGGGGSDF